jgi:hypothetical protein
LSALEGTAAVFGGAYFRDKCIVRGGAAATATTIPANERLFRSAFAAALLAVGVNQRRRKERARVAGIAGTMPWQPEWVRAEQDIRGRLGSAPSEARG